MTHEHQLQWTGKELIR